MKITLTLNGKKSDFEIQPGETLLSLLRRLGLRSVKFGSEDGTDGYSTVLINGHPRSAVVTLAAQVHGAEVLTVEGLGGPQQRGWKGSAPLHPIQQAFVEAGAIQSGYDTPALILAAKALLDRNPKPTEAEVRDAISGIVSRETGHAKPVAAILRAAAVMRGETPEPLTLEAAPTTTPGEAGPSPRVITFPTVILSDAAKKFKVVGQPTTKVDALKLVQGKPVFTADFERPGMLYAKILHSPYAHARILDIDTSKAEALPGVHAVLTYKNVPRIVFSSAGQSYPIPGPKDYVSFDNKVRYVGDRVAAVAAETPEIAEAALRLIKVDYEVLQPVLSIDEAMAESAPVIHDQADYVKFADSDPQRNHAASVRIELGDVDRAMEEADFVFEGTYEVQRMKHVPLEPWVCLTYWDEDDRLVIVTSTQVPFHVRRILAPVLGLSEKRIHVIKPRIGGAFGNKQEIYEDIAGHLTIATGRPVLMELTREEQFVYTVTRHSMRVQYRVGVMKDGTMVAQDLRAISDTGAYGGHALTVLGNVGHKTLALYKTPHLRFHGDTVYTNRPRSGAFRGYGVTQGVVATETVLTRAANALGMDPIIFRLKNLIEPGDEHMMSKAWSEGRAAHGEIIQTNALREAVAQGAAAMAWDAKFGNPEWHTVPGNPNLRRGIGMTFLMQGSGIPNLDMAAATIKMNDDGSFNLHLGAADLGTGADTVLAQIAAEVLGCSLDNFIVLSGDTDLTPFDKGAYASSTTYISGGAAARAAEQVAAQIREVAAQMVGDEPDSISLHDTAAWTEDGRRIPFRDIALSSLHTSHQHQIMGQASFLSPVSPPPFAVQFAEVTVDMETGQVTTDRLLIAMDSGQIINPLTACGQAEGGMHQALGYALTEELVFDPHGRILNPRFDDYRVFRADEMPPMETIFVETFEPSHPMGAKSVSEIVVNGVAPAVINAVYDATGVMMHHTPLTPERVWQTLTAVKQANANGVL